MERRVMKLTGLLTLIFACLVGSSVSAQCVAPSDLNGVWKANDGGTYYVRQVGSDVWWLGVSADGGIRFTNVYKGRLNGNTVVGQWADVRGQVRNSGALNLRVNGGNTVTGFQTIMMSGGFSGMSWYQSCGDTSTSSVKH
jgi:hypothetical protein